MSAWETYLRANAKMDGLIDLAPTSDRSIPAIRRRAIERFRWMQDFVNFLDHPHVSVPVIHVTGTSGKGSTATAIASILRAAGLRTLLHTSPYLQVATEKLQIEDKLIAADELDRLTDTVIDAGERFRPGELTYGEAWMALVFMAMERFRPDVAIVEVGAGGRYDVSNVVRPEVAVITTVGLDHTESLGETIPEIAWHKAGVVKPGVHLVHSVTQPEAIALIDQEAVVASRVTRVTSEPEGIDPEWRDPVTGERLRNGIPGSAQRTNGAVAVAAARAFLPDLNSEAIRKGLARSRMAARFERMPGDQMVVLDGAHNQQKMSALTRDVIALSEPRIAVIGFLASKRYDEMVRQIAPSVDSFVVAEPKVAGKLAQDSRTIANHITGLTGKPVLIAESVEHAVERAREMAGLDGSVIVTGSLYLCGQAREAWFASDQIVGQQTQWPI